jgi:hypothetical protein
VLHQKQDESSLTDPTITKIEQAFAKNSLVCERIIPFETPPS